MRQGGIAAALLLLAAILGGLLLSDLPDPFTATDAPGDAGGKLAGPEPLPGGVPGQVPIPTAVPTATLPTGLPAPSGLPGATGAPVPSTKLSPASAGGASGSTSGDDAQPLDAQPRLTPDREGGSDQLVCYHVFEPDIGCMKRWIALDRIDADQSLSQTQTPHRTEPTFPGLVANVVGRFPVTLDPELPTPIFSWAPQQRLVSFELSPPVPGERVTRDGTDTFYLEGPGNGTHEVTIRLRDDSSYHSDDVPKGLRFSDAPPSDVPLPDAVRRSVEPWLAQKGWPAGDDLSTTLSQMRDVFRAFGEGEIAPSDPDFFHALVTSQVGCCRHRAAGFVMAAQTMGLHARLVFNEAHAFAEVELPTVGWRAFDLGGCGTTSARDERPPPLPPAPRAPILTFTDITDSPRAATKSDRFLVEGTVSFSDRRGVANVPVDVFLNESKSEPGHLVGHATTDASGRFSTSLAIPTDLPARDYQLVAHYGGDASRRESWSDPPISVSDGTRLELSVPARALALHDTPITLRLRDAHGVPIEKASVLLDLGEGAPVTVVTDANGTANLSPRWSETPRQVSVVARFDGDANHGSSGASASVRVLLLRLTELREIEGVRGEALNVSLHLTDHGEPLDAFDLRVTTPWGESVNATDAGGDLAFALPIPPTARLGPAEVAVASVEPDGFIERFAGRVAARTHFAIPWAGPFETGTMPSIPARLLDDRNEPVPGASVEGSGAGTFRVLTEADGSARVLVPQGIVAPSGIHFAALPLETYTGAEADIALVPAHLSASPDDPRAHSPLTFVMRVTGSDGQPIPSAQDGTLFHVAALSGAANASANWTSERVTFSVDLPAGPAQLRLTTDMPGSDLALAIEVASPPLLWPWFVAGGVVLVGAVALILLRGRRRGPDAPASVAAALRILARRTQMTARLADAPDGTPFASAPGEPLVLDVLVAEPPDAKEPHAISGDVRWRVDEREGSSPIDHDGRARLEIVLPRGEHTIRLDARLASPHAGARMEVAARVAPWDEQVARDYESLRVVGKAAAPRLPKGFTPRVMERALEGRADARAMDEALTIFERSNYSPASTMRDDWIAFTERASTLRGALAAEAPA